MSSQNKENHFRLLLLLVDGAALVERKVFDSKVTGTLSSFLSANLGVLKDLRRKRAINDSQFTLLNSNNPSSDDFDISLLTCLLRNICGLAKTMDTVWTKPDVNDHSTEADITRIKEHRNKILHLPEIGITQLDFQHEWSEICQVLTHLNAGLQNGIPDLQRQLDAYKTCSIDQETEKQCESKLRNWEALDIAQQNMVLEKITAMRKNLDEQYSIIQNDIEDMKKAHADQQLESAQQHKCTRDLVKEEANKITRKLDEPKLSQEQERLIDYSKRHFDEADVMKKIFIKTKSYEEARTKLDKSGIVVLSGNPGEGKTTMANMLLLESSPVGSILKLADPLDWRIVPKGYNGILIDDIFGCSMIDHQLLRHWGRYLPDLISQANKKIFAAVVITTRNYILNEAKQKLSVEEMFSEIITLSSEGLSPEERLKILNIHLKENSRNLDEDSKSRICSAEGINSDTQMIGFPVCTYMFSNDDSLFAKGCAFFEAPYEYCLKCIRAVSNNWEQFMSLILVWAEEPDKFQVSDLDPDAILKLSEVAKDFQYTRLIHNAISIRENLKQFAECFLTYDDNEETYSFRHHIIGDAVGIVAADTLIKAVIKYGLSSFIRRHVTTREDKGVHILLKKPQYILLVEKFNRLLFVEEYTESCDEQGNRRVDQCTIELPDGRIGTTFSHNSSILQHEAFSNIEFIREYLNTKNDIIKKNCLSVPISHAGDYFKPDYQISFPKNEMPLCMPSSLLALGNDTMIAECIERDMLTEKEKCIALLLAVKHNRLRLVKDLVMKANVVVSVNSLKIAANDKSGLFEFLINQTPNPSAYIPTSDEEVLSSEVQSRTFEPIVIQYQSAFTVKLNNVKEARRDVVSYLLGCQRLLERKSNLPVLEEDNWQNATHSVYKLGCAEFLNKLMHYVPPDDMFDIDSHERSQAIINHSNTNLVQMLLSDDILYEYRRLMKYKIGKQSLFHNAVLYGDIMLLQIAKELRLDPNRRDVYGRSPIYLAAYYGKVEFVKTMLSIPHIDLEMTDRNCYTPLHAAVWKDESVVVSLLLHRVNVNCRDNRGNTPLHIACKNGNKNMIRTLIAGKKTDVRVINKCGDTVFDLLKSYEVSERHTVNIHNKLRHCYQLLHNKDPEVNDWLSNMKNNKGDTFQL